MSTSQVPTESRQYSIGYDPDDAFDDIAFNDPTVCSRCFALIRRHDTYRPDADGGVSQYAPTERCIRAFNGAKGHKIAQTNDYGYRPLHEPRTFCGECGSQSGHADDDDLSRCLAVQFADNLADRLVEANVVYLDGVLRDALKYLIGRFKSDDRLHGIDTEIFRASTRIAIKHARNRRHG